MNTPRFSAPALRVAAILTAGLAGATPLLTPAAPATAAADGLRWVTGVVVDSDGNPVEGALVNVLPPREIPELGVLDDSSDRWTVTDEDGEFRVRQDDRGFLVQVCQAEPDNASVCRFPGAADYLVRYVGPDGAFDSWVQHTGLYDASGIDLALGEVEVQPPARIEGTLAGAHNEPIQVMRLNDTVAFNGQTDADGDFTIDGLAPGTYYLQAGGFGTLQWQSDPVTVDAANPAEVDGVLEPGTTLAGTVVDEATGAPGGRTEIFLASADGDPIASLLSNRKGEFRFTGLTPGDYLVGQLRQVGKFIPGTVPVTVADEEQVDVTVELRRGASVTVHFRGTEGRVDSELRDRDGEVLYPNLQREDGAATYPGLRPGRYTLVAKDEDGYGIRSFRVRGAQAKDIGRLRLDQPLLTLRGRTAPNAVVEATTSDLCPADAPFEQGAFHEIEQADASGRYVIRGLVPGEHWMVGSDGYPANYAPICHDDVVLTSSRRYDVPLEVGRVVTGRLVYAGTDLPVVTNIGYQVTYPEGLVTNPTEEHPAVTHARGSSGRFTIDGLSAGTATGDVPETGHFDTTGRDLWFFFPYQYGTPYWLEAEETVLALSGDVDLGDVELTLQGG